jgi:hypothetical protein
MGYNTQQFHVYVVNGTQAFVISGADYPVTFEDSQAKIEQVIKTFHATSWTPVAGSGCDTATPTPTTAPTTVAPTATAAPTTVAPTATAAPTTAKTENQSEPETETKIDN